MLPSIRPATDSSLAVLRHRGIAGLRHQDPGSDFRQLRSAHPGELEGMNELLGKKALVTGGSRGIGAATAIALAERGADVALHLLRVPTDAAAEVVKEIEALGRRAYALEVDAADAVAVADGVQRAADRLGRLDILVNDAGIGVLGPGIGAHPGRCGPGARGECAGGVPGLPRGRRGG